jgi:hypothetical protein
MTTQNVMAVGYIRTTTYKRLVPLLGPERITRITGSRRLLKQRRREDIQFLTAIWSGQTTYSIDWRKGQQGPFPVRVMNRLLEERKVTDMVVQAVDALVESPAAISHLNTILKARYEGTRMAQVLLEPTDRILLHFENNPSDDACHLPYIEALNSDVRQSLNSTTGVMDLKSIRTERWLKYGEREEWDLNDITLLKTLLRTLHKDGWPEAERFVEEGGVRHVASPFAVRIYTKHSKVGWELSAFEEVNGA